MLPGDWSRRQDVWGNMLTNAMVFRTELEKLITEAIVHELDGLVNNRGNTVEDYRYVQGKIAALKNIENLIDEAAESAEKRR